MATTMTLYGGFFQSIANKQINLNSDALAVMLLTSSYTPSDAHRYQSDIASYEIAGTGYAAGGAALGGQSAVYTTATKTLALVPTNAFLAWNSSTIAAQYAALVDQTPGAAASNPLIAYANMGAVISDTNGTFQINWNASGIFTITHA